MNEDLHKRMITLYEAGHSVGEISRRLGTNKQRVARALAKAGVRPLGRMIPQPERDAAMARDYAAGMTSPELAAKYRVAKSWVPTIVRRAGVTPRPAGGRVAHVSDAERVRIVELWSSGLSAWEIQDATGVHQRRVRRTLDERGIKFERRLRTGLRHPKWKEGRIKDHGYYSMQIGDSDPHAAMRDRRGYVLEHRLVMARKLGRDLKPNETVHHINGNKRDNRPENLQLRHGKHGKHECYQCVACGSRNITTVPLDEVH